MRCLTSVVLPEPFWPRMATASPGSIAARRRARPRRRSGSDGRGPRSRSGRARRVDGPGDHGGPAVSGAWLARDRGRPAAPPPSPQGGGDAASSNAPAGLDAGQPRRAATRVGGRSPTSVAGRARAPARAGRARPAGPPSRTRQRSIRPSTAGSCSAHRIAVPARGQLVEQVGDRRGPGRVELGGRLVEDEDGRPHRDDARDGDPLLLAARQRERLAVGQVGDAKPVEDGVDPRVHLGARHAQVLEPERELLADGQLRGRQLVGRRREDDADPPEQRVRGGASSCLIPPIIDPARRASPGRRAG